MMAQDLIGFCFCFWWWWEGTGGERAGAVGELFMNITNGILRLLKPVLKRTSLFRFVGQKKKKQK